MAQKGSASIDDILLLFIYLELGAMVGIYFKTKHMPVAILVLALATLAVRYGSAHFPSVKSESDN